MTRVPDACAVIAFLRDEPGADKMERLLTGQKGGIHIHAVNQLEVYYKLASFGGESAAEEAIRDIGSLQIRVHSALDKTMVKRAGFFKLRFPFLSLADSICIALAERLRGIVVTSDRPFVNVREYVDIDLIR